MIKETFFAITSNWTSYKWLLWASLEATKKLKLPVLELGAGDGSTLLLREYCKDEGLEFVSYDFNKKFADEFESIHVENWDTIPWRRSWGVVLCDESPGENRKISLSRLHHAQIICAHDTEKVGAGDYQMRPEIEKYKYYCDWETSGAWATAMSDHIDVRQFAEAMRIGAL